MSMRWERFAGDTSSFAVRLAFHRDPDDGEAATPDMAESWGAFQLWVRGKNLCAHIDQGEELRSCHWYLLPLLEWLSGNWDPLFHEERPPAGRSGIGTASGVSGIASASAYAMETDGGLPDEFEQQYEWRGRHALRAAAQGGVFPDVRFRRFRDQVEVSWAANPLPGAEHVYFMSPEGVDYLSPSAVAHPRARRFTLAHELCHLLHDRSYGALLAIASGPWAPRNIERRANAFAAWLLMPPHRLKPAIAWAHGAINTNEGISAVANELDVSRSALVRHLFNLGEITEEDQDALLAGAGAPRRP